MLFEKYYRHAHYKKNRLLPLTQASSMFFYVCIDLTSNEEYFLQWTDLIQLHFNKDEGFPCLLMNTASMGNNLYGPN